MEDFIDRACQIRNLAARFYAVDLHLHSPASYDWNNSSSEDQPRNPDLDRIPPGEAISESAKTAYRELMEESNRDLLAITDHNVSTFSEKIARGDIDSSPCILPGIELTVCFSDAPLIQNLRLHILAVFPEDIHHDAIARIFPAETLPEEERDPKTPLSYTSVDELIEKIHREGGLAIAAHIESEAGLRGIYKNTMELNLEPIKGSQEAQEVLKTLGKEVKDELIKFDAIQVKPTTERVHYESPDGKLRVSLIVATDCHSAHDIAVENLDYCSYIKMAQPSFKALRDALKFPDARVRFKTSLPEAKPPRLLGLRLLGREATEKTFFDDIVLGFSDNLTCIIGPRGSGKSALIDALRYLIGGNRGLHQQLPKVADQITDRQQHTLEKTRIEAIYQTVDGNKFRLVATYDSQEEYVTEVYDSQGDKLNIDDVEASGDFPLSLFGWGELELLAENPDTQRELLDRFIPEVSKLKMEKEKLYLQLETNREECVKKAQNMEAYFTEPESDFRRLNEFKTRFEELNTEEISEVFSQLDKIKAKREVLDNIHNELQQRDEGENDIFSPLEIERFFGSDNILEDENLKEWTETLSERLKMQEFDDWVHETSSEYDRRIKGARKIVREEQKELSQEQKNTEQEIQSVIGEDQAITGDLRNRAKERYEKAKTNYDKYRQLQKDFDTLLNKRREVLTNDIEDCSKRIFETRNRERSRISDKVSLVEDEDYKINLILRQQADKSELLSTLKEGDLNFHGHWRANKHAEILSYKLTPQKLAQIILTKERDALKGLAYRINDQDYSISCNAADRLVADNTPYDEIEELDVTRVDPEKLDILLNIEEISIDDEFIITLGGKPIQYCSPGQRCSAMLPIVTLTTHAPLIIDQPEDNLDNRLVSQALFKILARLKETRQLIIATHNPNILVSGDAEQVLLLSPDGDLERYGSIDNPQIIKTVLGLMEGGPEAFQRREEKYDPYIYRDC